MKKYLLTIIFGLLLAFNVQAHTLTAQSNAQVDTAQSKFGGGSFLSDHTGDTRITMPDHADFAFGSGNFTLEAWVRFANATSSNGVLIHQWGAAGNRAFYLQFQPGSDIVEFRYTTDGTNSAALQFNTWNPSIDTWYHVEVSRNGADLQLFIDGTGNGVSNISTDSIFNSTSTFELGGITAVAEGFDGWIDEVRVSNIARHTSNFTPETAAYTCADSNTVLLVHADGADASTTFTDDETACAAGGAAKPRRVIIQ